MVGIYCIENKRNSKKYIGQSKDVSRRFIHHRYYLKKGKHVNSHLQRAWNKYGSENFEFYLLEECPEENLTIREEYWISHFGACVKGYNLIESRKPGHINSEIRNKMSKTRTGRKYSESHKKAISDALSGRVLSEEHKKNISKNHANVSGENSGRFGNKNINSSSKFFGVHFHKSTNRWEASFSLSGKQIYVGRFTDEEEAARRYNQYIIDNNLPNHLNVL